MRSLKPLLLTAALIACFSLAALAGEDVAPGIEELRAKAESGDAIAQYNLGWMFANGRGIAQDDAEAVKWFRKAAEQGYASAQSNLGVMYEQGRGVEQDYAEAVKWYRKAAEQGDAIAQ